MLTELQRLQKECPIELPPDSSALFVLVRKAQPERLLAELSAFQSGMNGRGRAGSDLVLAIGKRHYPPQARRGN